MRAIFITKEKRSRERQRKREKKKIHKNLYIIYRRNILQQKFCNLNLKKLC